jgi:hypothetical protein
MNEDDITLITEENVNKLLKKYDEYFNLVFLLHQVNGFEPRDKWIIPILKSCECADFKTQLLTAIEDYEQ